MYNSTQVQIISIDNRRFREELTYYDGTPLVQLQVQFNVYFAVHTGKVKTKKSVNECNILTISSYCFADAIPNQCFDLFKFIVLLMNSINNLTKISHEPTLPPAYLPVPTSLHPCGHIFTGKSMFLYIAQCPVRWTAQSTLHFTPWQTCSFQHQLDFSGKYSATLQVLTSHFPITVCHQILVHSRVNTDDVERKKLAKLRNVRDGHLTAGPLKY